MKVFENKIILITGGTGSFGSTVLKRLLDYPVNEIRIFSRDENKQDNMRNSLNNNKVKFYIGDVKDYKSISLAIKDVNYVTRDADGNEYTVTSSEGEIDLNNENILFLTNVKALIKLKNASQITIVSDYGKYNTDNFDTIFSKNVIINYLDNKITGEYLDFSIKRNSMIISRNVIYSNLNNVLFADVVEMNLKTKDTKIYMYENEKKVNIRNK